MAPAAQTPDFGPSKRLDYELELGVLIGAGNALGEPIAHREAERARVRLLPAERLVGARHPGLGVPAARPVSGQELRQHVSPWIITLEALAPFRLAWTRAEGDPQPLAYLDSPDTRERGAIDIQLEVALETEAMGRERHPAARLACTSFKHSYWTVSQMVTHHTVNGCGLKPGDLLGSGTESGPTPEEAGSLLELTVGGKQPVQLPNGETRSFLEDGDTVILRAWLEARGCADRLR